MIDIKIGDCRKLIHELENESIDCVMTSPPYWGLRDYKTESIIFDGLQDCEHDFSIELVVSQSGGINSISGNGKSQPHHEAKTNFCSKCGAWRGQLGLEPTPELYIKHILDFFDDVKLKMKAEGNCFVNLGDTYSGSGGAGGDYNEGGLKAGAPKWKQGESKLKPKSLCMIPQRFAWGMIERGWILRNEIIWAKPNHMPESVTDRLTKAHEVIYHFVKQQKYYYNLDVIREKHKTSPSGYTPYDLAKGKSWGNHSMDAVAGATSKNIRAQHPLGKNPGDVWKNNISGMTRGELESEFIRLAWEWQRQHPEDWTPEDVWSITTQPYLESHFAVFPLELVRRPILAGCPIGGTVLDPFGGSGTVGEFCRHNERNAILFELNPGYVKLIKERSMADIPELDRFV